MYSISQNIIMEEENDDPENIMKNLEDDFDKVYFKKEIENRESLMNGALQVYLRIRPTNNTDEQNEFTIKLDEDLSSIYIGDPTNGRNYRFCYTKIFNEVSSQNDVFDVCLSANIEKFLFHEISCLIFTYGITNSGKTYTMQGNISNLGVLPRFLATLFITWQNFSYQKQLDVSSKIDATTLTDTSNPQLFKLFTKNIEPLPFSNSDAVALADFIFSFSISFVEIYNENVYDLLNPIISTTKSSSNLSSKFKDPRYSKFGDPVKSWNQRNSKISNSNNAGSLLFKSISDNNLRSSKMGATKGNIVIRRKALQIGEDRNGNIYIKNLTEVNVTCLNEVMQYLEEGKKNLKMASTMLNYNSSRSHSVFVIKLHKTSKYNPNLVITNEFTFCDLAGAERTVKTGNVGERLFEAKNINTSLLTLSRCLQIIKYNQIHREKPQIIPFRESKLTRLFQNYFLKPNSKISMIVNISKNANMYSETLHSLKFSALAKKIILNTIKPFAMPSRRHLNLLKQQTQIDSRGSNQVETGGLSESEEVEEDEDVEQDIKLANRIRGLIAAGKKIIVVDPPPPKKRVSRKNGVNKDGISKTAKENCGNDTPDTVNNSNEGDGHVCGEEESGKTDILYDIEGTAYNFKSYRENYEKQIKELREKMSNQEGEISRKYDAIYSSYYNTELKSWKDYYEKNNYLEIDTYETKIKILHDNIDRCMAYIDMLKKQMSPAKVPIIIRYLDGDVLTEAEKRFINVPDEKNTPKANLIINNNHSPVQSIKVFSKKATKNAVDNSRDHATLNITQQSPVVPFTGDVISSTMVTSPAAYKKRFTLKPSPINELSKEQDSSGPNTIIRRKNMSRSKKDDSNGLNNSHINVRLNGIDRDINADGEKENRETPTKLTSMPRTTHKRTNKSTAKKNVPLKDNNLSDAEKTTIKVTRTALKRRLKLDPEDSNISTTKKSKNVDEVADNLDLNNVKLNEIKSSTLRPRVKKQLLLPSSIAPSNDANFGANDNMAIQSEREYLDGTSVKPSRHITIHSSQQRLPPSRSPKPIGPGQISKLVKAIPTGIVKQTKASLLRFMVSPRSPRVPGKGYHSRCTPSPKTPSSTIETVNPLFSATKKGTSCLLKDTNHGTLFIAVDSPAPNEPQLPRKVGPARKTARIAQPRASRAYNLRKMGGAIKRRR